mgnify:CR=1 FL=1
MKKLNNREIKKVNGGHKGAAYKAGKFVGDAVEVVVTVLGIKKLKFW